MPDRSSRYELTQKESIQRESFDVTEYESPHYPQRYMSSWLRGWPGSTTELKRPEEDTTPMLQSPLTTWDVGRIEHRRQDLHGRKSSRNAQSVRTDCSPHEPCELEGSPVTPVPILTPMPTPTPMVVVPPNRQRFRLSAVIPFVLSGAAFGITLVLVLAGSKADYMTDLNVLSFNTTNLGTGIIEFSPTSSTTAAASTTASALANLRRRTEVPTLTTMTSSKVDRRQASNPLDPFGIVPALSSVVVSRASVDASVLGSAGSAVTSAVPLPSISLPGLPSPTGLLSSNSSSTSTGLLGAIGDLLTDGLTSILSLLADGLGASRITQAVDDALNEAIEGMISDILSKAGVQDYYSLHVLSTCKGSSSSNTSSCSAFSSTADSISNVSAKIPSSLVVHGTNVSSPAVRELTSAVSSLGPTINSVQKFFLALMIISLINSGLAIVLSFLGIILPQNRVVLYGNVSLVSIGLLTRSVDAVLATVISVTICFVTNKFGNSLGVSAKSGGLFIALIWVGFASQLLSSLYWLSVWFVEFRQISFRIRKREATEIGNYEGIFGEVRSDFRSPKKPVAEEKPFIV